MTLKVLDSPNPHAIALNAGAIKAAGYYGVILYISPINISGDKTVKKADLNLILAAGLKVAFVCEGWGGVNNFSHGDITAATGTRDGGTCGRYLASLGAPVGVAIYAAIDTDTSAAQINGLCVPYFKAFRAALPVGYKLGAYGCGSLLTVLWAQKLIAYRWLSQSMGWSGSRAYVETNQWDIIQNNTTRVFGIDVDPNQLNPARSTFGFWGETEAAPAPAAPAAAAPAQTSWLGSIVKKITG